MTPKNIDKIDSYIKARQVVLRLLRYRWYSQKEIASRLKTKGFSQRIIDKTIRIFKNSGVIDDQRFARELISSRLAKPVSLTKIMQELAQKEISVEIRQRELSRIKATYDEPKEILKLIERKTQKGYKITNLNELLRLKNYLLRRGYGVENINTILQGLWTYADCQ